MYIVLHLEPISGGVEEVGIDTRGSQQVLGVLQVLLLAQIQSALSVCQSSGQLPRTASQGT
jgi:hypothetical protein